MQAGQVYTFLFTIGFHVYVSDSSSDYSGMVAGAVPQLLLQNVQLNTSALGTVESLTVTGQWAGDSSMSVQNVGDAITSAINGFGSLISGQFTFAGAGFGSSNPIGGGTNTPPLFGISGKYIAVILGLAIVAMVVFKKEIL